MPLLRIMMIDNGTGQPKIGAKSFQLGVRPLGGKYADVSASSDSDLVTPDKAQGLSCSAQPIGNYIVFAKPLLDFDCKRRIWEIDSAQLHPALIAVQRPSVNDPDHWQIEPAFPMTLGEFQNLLAWTVDKWKVIQLTSDGS